jgi:hypothetical protein
VETTYWMWDEILCRLHNNQIPEIWKGKEQGWQLSNVLTGLIVGGDASLDQVSAERMERKAPGSTSEDAEIIETTSYLCS